MREIKFRLRIGNRIVGYERNKPDEDGYLISTYSFDNSIGGWLFEPIKHKNKDEFIGLKDKNGKEIYEGDIVKWLIFPENCEPTYIVDSVSFSNGSFKVEKRCELLGLKEPHRKLEIISNIYENPELLKSEK